MRLRRSRELLQIETLVNEMRYISPVLAWNFAYAAGLIVVSAAVAPSLARAEDGRPLVLCVATDHGQEVAFSDVLSVSSENSGRVTLHGWGLWLEALNRAGVRYGGSVCMTLDGIRSAELQKTLGQRGVRYVRIDDDILAKWREMGPISRVATIYSQTQGLRESDNGSRSGDTGQDRPGPISGSVQPKASAPKRDAENKAEAELRAKADAERQRRADERVAAEQRKKEEAEQRKKDEEAEAELAKRQREEEEAGRPIAFYEGLAVCKEIGGSSLESRCYGPLQMTIVQVKSLDDPPTRGNVGMACGASTDLRDLGQIEGYRIFGCGFGIHPDENMRDYPGNIDTYHQLHVTMVPGRRTFYCKRSRLAYCKGE